MRADEDERLQFLRDSQQTRKAAEAALTQRENSSHFITSGSNGKAAPQSGARQDNSSQFITSNNNHEDKDTAPTARPGTKQDHSSLFITSNTDDDYKVATIRRAQLPTGRNQTCPCKSGKKFKHCCLNNKKAA